MSIELHTNKKNIYQGALFGKKSKKISRMNNKIASKKIIIEMRETSFE